MFMILQKLQKLRCQNVFPSHHSDQGSLSVVMVVTTVFVVIIGMESLL